MAFGRRLQTFSIAVRNQVGPVAAVCVDAEGQTLRAVKHITAAVYAIGELSAFGWIGTASEITVLMGTVFGRVGWF